MVAYVVIPGIDGSDAEHWQTSWEQEWGSAAVRIAPSSWSTPDLDDWVDAIQRASEEASADGDSLVLVAHSLGCWAAASWLDQDSAIAVAGALLVAPPDPRGPAFPADAAPGFVELTAQPLRCPSLVVSSGDDPYCSPQTAAALAARWGARFETAGTQGHLNSASRLGSWQAGRRLLDSLVLG